MMSVKRTLSAAMLLCGIALLSGCLTKATPETRFYILDTGQDAPRLQNQASANPPNVEISSLQIPQYLDRNQLVTRPSQHRLKVHEFHRWGGNLRKNLTRLLARGIGEQLNTTQVPVVPHRSRVPIDYQLLVRIQRFELGPDQQVQLSAQWTLLHKDRKKTMADKAVTHSVAIANPNDMDAVVDAMSQLFNRLIDDIASQIAQQHH